MNKHVVNNELREEDIPPSDCGWHEHSEFAHNFFAYDCLGSYGAVAKLANAAFRRYKENGSLPGTLTELRICLFYEHRRAVHFSEPTEEMRLYAKAMLQSIRTKVQSGELD